MTENEAIELACRYMRYSPKKIKEINGKLTVDISPFFIKEITTRRFRRWTFWGRWIWSVYFISDHLYIGFALWIDDATGEVLAKFPPDGAEIY